MSGPRHSQPLAIIGVGCRFPGAGDLPAYGRLLFAGRCALAELPRTIEALQAEIAALQQALADPGLYRRDAASFATKTARLAAAQAEVEAAETEWLELELLREQLDS